MRARDLLPPEGLTADYGEVHRGRKERANAFLRERGIVPERLAELLRESRNGIAELLRSPFEGKAGEVYTAAKFAELYPDTSPAIGPLAFATHPPYEGWQQGDFFERHGRQRISRKTDHTTEPADGLVGAKVWLIQ